jgi:hypothetical protein
MFSVSKLSSHSLLRERKGRVFKRREDRNQKRGKVVFPIKAFSLSLKKIDDR